MPININLLPPSGPGSLRGAALEEHLDRQLGRDLEALRNNPRSRQATFGFQPNFRRADRFSLGDIGISPKTGAGNFAFQNAGRQQSLPFRGSMAIGQSTQVAPANRFIKWFTPPTKGTKLMTMGRAAKAGLPLELLMLGVTTVAGGIMGAAQWGAPTGLEEDYVGGAVFGATKEFGGGLASAVGATIGASVGSLGGPAGTIAGGIVGGVGGYIAGVAASTGPSRALGMGARAIIKTARAMDRIQFGGSFMDTREAFTMRQMAIQEMSGSMLNARQYLGNEAIFLHER